MRTPRVVQVRRLGAYVEAWDRLVDAAPLPTPFLRSWWIDGLADDRACLLLVLDDDELIGGLALERVPSMPGVARYRVLGGGPLSPDHLDLLALPDRTADVVAALAGWLRQGSKVLDLRGLRADATLLEAIPGARVSTEEVAPYEPLVSLDDYVAARSAGFGRRMRRRQRQVAGRDVVVRRLEAAEVAAGFDDLTALHVELAGHGALVDVMPRVREVVVDAARRGEVWMYVAERAGQRGAVLLCLVLGGRMSLYQVARRATPEFADAGTVLIHAAICDACTEGLIEVDFLRGTEDYKSTFAAHRRDLLRVRMAHGPAARLMLSVELLVRRVTGRN